MQDLFNLIPYKKYMGVASLPLYQRLIEIENRYHEWLEQGAPSKKPPFGTATGTEVHEITQQYEADKRAVMKQIRELRVAGEAQGKNLEPYSVLELPQTASGKEIYLRYKKLKAELIKATENWKTSLDNVFLNKLPAELEIWSEHYYTYKLVTDSDRYNIVQAAYESLSKQKPYNPNSLLARWFPRWF